jgi:tape measure domain-containing protein
MSRMSLDTAIRLSAEVKGGSNITKVQRSLQDLAQGSRTTARDISTLRAATFQFARANDSTIAGVRNSIVAFRGLQEQAKIGSREFQRYGAEIQKLEGKLKGVDGAADKVNGGFNGLIGSAGRLLAAYAGIESLRFVFGNAAELESQTRSLEVLTGSAESAKQIVQELQQLGAVTPFTSSELIDSAKRLQAFGVETEKVVDVTRRLADVSGATGAELQGIVVAYGQVQAKGRLQGEELLQFQERGVALQQELRKMYGLTGAEFQKALEKGQISAKAVEIALINLTNSGGKYANGAIAQSDTLRGRLSTLQDSIQVLAQTIGKTLDPVFKWALTQATSVVSEIQRLIDEANNAGGARDREAQFARNANAAVQQMGLNPFTQQGMMAEMRQRNIEQQRADYALSRQRQRTQVAPAPTALPPLAGPRDSAASGGGGGGTARAAESRGAQIAKALQGALSLTPAQAAGIVGNLQRESGLNSRFNEGGAVGLPSGVGGYGLAQWTGTRQKDLIRFAGGGAAAGDLQTQLRFMVQELMGKESKALASLRRTTSPEEAAVAFDRDYERSGVKALGERKANARRVYGEIAGGGPGAGLDDFAKQLEQQAQAAEKMQEQQDVADQLNTKLKDRLAILLETDPLKRQALEFEIRQNEIAREYNELRIQSLSADETILINASEAIDKRIAQIEYERELNQLMEERAQLMFDITRAASMPTVYNELETQEAALQAVLDKYPAIGAAADAAASMVTAGVSEMIAGTKSAEQVFSEFLQAVADALMETAQQMIAQYIAIGIAKMFAGLGSAGGAGDFAASGPLAAVGDINPAVNFNPVGALPSFAGGGYTGAGAMAGGLDGKGGFMALLHPNETVIPGNPYAATASALEGGSSLSAARPSNEPIKLETRVINGVEYATIDQLQQATRQAESRGAERGRALALGSMRNSVKTRKQLGMA